MISRCQGAGLLTTVHFAVQVRTEPVALDQSLPVTTTVVWLSGHLKFIQYLVNFLFIGIVLGIVHVRIVLWQRGDGGKDDITVLGSISAEKSSH